jgi:hypothetical protein
VFAARDRTRNGCGANSRGETQIPGEHRPARFCPQGWDRDENGLPGGARLRSGRTGRSPVSHVVDGKWLVEVACASGSYAADLAIARNRRHGSCVTGRLHGWARGKESSRNPAIKSWNGESGRETPDHDAPATIGSRTRKGVKAQETGHGSSGGESSGGTFQGRERHETRPRSVGGLGKRRASQGVRARRDDQPKPSRGARTLRTAPAEGWQPPSASPVRAGLVSKGHPT